MRAILQQITADQTFIENEYMAQGKGGAWGWGANYPALKLC